MKPLHRWLFSLATLPCLVVGMLAMYEAWWIVRSDAAVCVFAGGCLIFGVGVALIEGARED